MRTSETKNEILSQRVTFLENVAPFADLKKSELSIVAEKLKPKKYKKKEIVFHQEDDSRSAFIIMKGTVRVVRINQGGNETTINKPNPPSTLHLQ